MAKNKDSIYHTILSAVFLLEALVSLYAYFLWEIGNYVMVICCGILILIRISAKRYFVIDKQRAASILLLTPAMLLPAVNHGNWLGLILSICNMISISTLISLRSEPMLKIFKQYTHYFSILVGVSLAAWIVHRFGVPIPHTISIFEQGGGNEAYVFDNYLLFMERQEDNIRFLSVFLEPGHLGMATSLLLAANGMNIKHSRDGLILLIVTLATLSLAAYVILGIAVFFHLFTAKNKYRYVSIISLFTLLISIWIASYNYNDGNNLIYNRIFSRFELTGDDDIIAGNNRFTETFDYWYADFLKSNDKWFGIGSELNYINFGSGNSGYKVFIATNGLVDTALVILFYFSLLYRRFTRQGLTLILLFLISYLQRGYPFWHIFLFSAVFGIENITNNKTSTHTKKLYETT